MKDKNILQVKKKTNNFTKQKSKNKQTTWFEPLKSQYDNCFFFQETHKNSFERATKKCTTLNCNGFGNVNPKLMHHRRY